MNGLMWLLLGVLSTIGLGNLSFLLFLSQFHRCRSSYIRVVLRTTHHQSRTNSQRMWKCAFRYNNSVAVLEWQWLWNLILPQICIPSTRPLRSSTPLLVLTTSQTSHHSLHLSTRRLSNYLLGCWQCIRWDASLLPRPSRQTQWRKYWRTPRTGIQQSSNVLRSKSEIICDSKCQTHRFLCYLLSCSHSQSSIWFGRSRMWLFGHPIQDFFVCNSNSQRVCESSYSSFLLHSLFQFFYSWLLHVNHSFLFASFGTLYFHCIESDQQASDKSMHRE